MSNIQKERIEEEHKKTLKDHREANIEQLKESALRFFGNLKTKISKVIADRRLRSIWMQNTGLTVRDVGMFAAGIALCVII